MKDYFIVAFYKAKLGDGKYIDDGISIYTTAVNAIGLLCLFQFRMAWKVLRNRYSHVEVWWGKEAGYNFSIDAYLKSTSTYSHTNYYGKMFTSTMRQGMSGTVIRNAYGVLKNPKRWDIMKIPREQTQIVRAKKWANWQADNNLGYNKKTIGNFFNPFRPTKKPVGNEPHICSVAVQGFCWMAGMFTSWSIWSPIKLWWKLTKLGYKTEPLIKEGI